MIEQLKAERLEFEGALCKIFPCDSPPEWDSKRKHYKLKYDEDMWSIWLAARAIEE